MHNFKSGDVDRPQTLHQPECFSRPGGRPMGMGRRLAAASSRDMRVFLCIALILSPVSMHEVGPVLSEQLSGVHGRSDGRVLSRSLVNELSPLVEQKIAQYKAGEGLIVNVHITHHAGTTLCNWARANGPTPNFGEYTSMAPPLCPWA